MASLVIITLVKAVRAASEHLLAAEMRAGQVRHCFHPARLFKATHDIVIVLGSRRSKIAESPSQETCHPPRLLATPR